MTPQHWKILIVVLGSMACTAGLLARMQSSQRLGKPGVKLSSLPVFNENGKMVGTNSVYLPEKVGEFISKAGEINDVEATWLPKDTTYGRRLYLDSNGIRFQTTVVLMGSDRTSIHKPQYCLTSSGWTIDKTEVVSIPMQRPHPYELKVMKLTTSGLFKGNDGVSRNLRGLYVYWFVADNQLTPFHGDRMWWLARDLLREGVLQRWAYISYFWYGLPGQEDVAFEKMKGLITDSLPEFQLATGGPAEQKRSADAPATPRSIIMAGGATKNTP